MNGADIMNPWIGAVPIGSPAAAATESGAGDASGGLEGILTLAAASLGFLLLWWQASLWVKSRR